MVRAIVVFQKERGRPSNVLWVVSEQSMHKASSKAELELGLPFWAHLILGTLRKVTVKHSQQQGGYPLVAEMMMMRRMTATTTPMIAIIFMFCHQYFLFSRVAWKFIGSTRPLRLTLQWGKFEKWPRGCKVEMFSLHMVWNKLWGKWMINDYWSFKTNI